MVQHCLREQDVVKHDYNIIVSFGGWNNELRGHSKSI